MDYGVIMAGGSGTRLWPLSRESRPKQLLPVVKGKTLLEVSYDRLRAILPAERIFVCTLEAHRDAILANLPELPRDNLLGEPEGRDTANAVGLPAAVLAARDPDAVFAITTADHVIEPVDDFQKSLLTGFDIARKHPKSLVTFGIVPTFAHTGLGYVQRGEPLDGFPGAFRVIGFREKPDKSTADKYVESRRYYWNSGMFVWRASTVLDQLRVHLPQSYAGLTKIAAAWGTNSQQATLKEVYPKLPKISVDYAIMEPASQANDSTGVEVAVVEMSVNWLDVGSWPALAETLAIDGNNNATDAQTSVLMDSDDNIIVSSDPEHLVSLVGVSDMIVVHTKDATMVMPKNESQRVKDLVGQIKAKYPGKYL